MTQLSLPYATGPETKRCAQGQPLTTFKASTLKQSQTDLLAGVAGFSGQGFAGAAVQLAPQRLPTLEAKVNTGHDDLDSATHQQVASLQTEDSSHNYGGSEMLILENTKSARQGAHTNRLIVVLALSVGQVKLDNCSTYDNVSCSCHVCAGLRRIETARNVCSLILFSAGFQSMVAG